jgi:hypothetical protein
MRSEFRFHGLGVPAAMALIMALAPSTISAQSGDSERISDLLLEARSHAMLANDYASTLESYSRSNLQWKSHAVKLENIRDHINELCKLNTQMGELRAEGSPWQQTAIDRIDEHLRKTAAQLSATITHLNENQSQVHMQTYRGYVQENRELTSSLAKLIGDFVDYGESNSEAEALEQRLELPVARSGI